MKYALRAAVLGALALSLAGCPDSTLRTAVLQKLGLAPTPIPSGGSQGVVIYSYGSYGYGLWPPITPPNVTYDANGAMTTASGWATNGTVADFGADGLVAWGRWTAGTLIMAPGGNLVLLHYAICGAATTPASLINFVKTYSAYRSTAPTFDVAGTVTEVGAADSVTGSLSVNYQTNICNYTLSIVIGSHSFTLSGSGSLAGPPTFSLPGAVTSSTDNVLGTGALMGGSFVQGVVVGTSAERILLAFGFSIPVAGGHNVSGAVVFR